jgi:hypothetical protein
VTWDVALIDPFSNEALVYRSEVKPDHSVAVTGRVSLFPELVTDLLAVDLAGVSIADLARRDGLVINGSAMLEDGVAIPNPTSAMPRLASAAALVAGALALWLAALARYLAFRPRGRVTAAAPLGDGERLQAQATGFLPAAELRMLGHYAIGHRVRLAPVSVETGVDGRDRGWRSARPSTDTAG